MMKIIYENNYENYENNYENYENIYENKYENNLIK